MKNKHLLSPKMEIKHKNAPHVIGKYASNGRTAERLGVHLKASRIKNQWKLLILQWTI